MLARANIKTVNVDEPYTTTELLQALASIDLERKSVALVHYGEKNRPLAIALRMRGARLAEFFLYEWRLPIDRGPLQSMVTDLIAGNVDAMLALQERRREASIATPNVYSTSVAAAIRKRYSRIFPVTAAGRRPDGGAVR